MVVVGGQEGSYFISINDAPGNVIYCVSLNPSRPDSFMMEKNIERTKRKRTTEKVLLFAICLYIMLVFLRDSVSNGDPPVVA